ncbi:MAG: orotate phosphoribosyltransferase [Rhizomicrobium sp.]|nr:orotate phosphoribosyltransferase [Rhizomicrobium sp.]
MADFPELVEVIKQRSYRRGTFKLASGAESEFYFNLKPTMMEPKGAYLSAQALLVRIRSESVDYIGGLEMGAVPVIACVAALSHHDGKPVNSFFVRKKAKDHGTQDLVEGLALGESLSGKRVMIVDDVATSGGSIIKAAEVARQAGAIVETALVIVDREEGATEALAAAGIRLLSALKKSDFL